jgi:hypothetical protein
MYLPLEIVDHIGNFLPKAKDYFYWISSCSVWWKRLGERKAVERFLAIKPLFFRGGVSYSCAPTIRALIEDVDGFCIQHGGFLSGKLLTEEFFGQILVSKQVKDLIFSFNCFNFDPEKHNYRLITHDLVVNITCEALPKFLDILKKYLKIYHPIINSEDLDIVCQNKDNKKHFAIYTILKLGNGGKEKLSFYLGIHHCSVNTLFRERKERINYSYPLSNRLSIHRYSGEWMTDGFYKVPWLDSKPWVLVSNEYYPGLANLFIWVVSLLDHMSLFKPGFNWFNPKLKTGKLLSQLTLSLGKQYKPIVDQHNSTLKLPLHRISYTFTCKKNAQRYLSLVRTTIKRSVISYRLSENEGYTC